MSAGKSTPIQSSTYSGVIIQKTALGYKVIGYDPTVRSFKINVRIIGEEYKNIDFTGKKYCIDKGIEIHYNSREHRFSSTEIKTRLKK